MRVHIATIFSVFDLHLFTYALFLFCQNTVVLIQNQMVDFDLVFPLGPIGWKFWEADLDLDLDLDLDRAPTNLIRLRQLDSCILKHLRSVR